MSDNPTIVFTEKNTVVIENRERPVPKEGEVLIKTRCTLISTGTELTILKGEFPPDSQWARYGSFPFIPGYDNVGDVIDAGPGVDRSLIGKRVASYGLHAAYVVTAERSAYVIQRDNLPDETAAFFTICEIVINSLRRANVSMGESVVIFGTGLLGQFAARLCRLFGARPVIAVDVADSRLQLLPKDSGIIPVNSSTADVHDAVKRATRQRGADVAFEVTGNAELIPKAITVLRKQGRFVILSGPRGRTSFDFHDLCNAPSYTIIGAHNSSHPSHETPNNPWTKPRHLELFVDLAADGELDVAPLISHRAPYTQAPALYQLLLHDRSRAMGVILGWR